MDASQSTASTTSCCTTIPQSRGGKQPHNRVASATCKKAAPRKHCTCSGVFDGGAKAHRTRQWRARLAPCPRCGRREAWQRRRERRPCALSTRRICFRYMSTIFDGLELNYTSRTKLYGKYLQALVKIVRAVVSLSTPAHRPPTSFSYFPVLDVDWCCGSKWSP